MLDLLIQNALVYDGRGGEPYRADIAIQGERITDVGRREGDQGAIKAEARAVIDATDLVATPGFVDVHAHSDYYIQIAPEAESKIRQGITTEICGNCGLGAFPLRGVALEEAREANEKLGLKVDWHTSAEFFERVAGVHPAINMATFVAHGNVRASVMGDADRAPTGDEMLAMKRDIEEAMDAGALGFSTGLIYAPGMFADAAELTELQRAAAKRGGIYSSHIRGEGDRLLGAAAEFFKLVREVGCQAQYSHLKASGARNWGGVEKIIREIDDLNAHGGCVRFDKYPYIASGTELAMLLPRWMRDGGRDAAVERLLDPAQRKRLIEELKEDYGEFLPWPTIMIIEAGTEAYEPYQGRRIAEIAVATGKAPEDVFVELLIQSRLHTQISSFSMSQEETDMAILHPLGMVCSDSEVRTITGPLSEGSPHPRAFGSFGKFFREYVKERKLLTMQEAVAKVTSLPCATFGFRDRGVLAPGYFADLVLLDLPAFRDLADFNDSRRYCEGVDTVVVNGILTMKGSRYTGERGGRALRRGE